VISPAIQIKTALSRVLFPPKTSTIEETITITITTTTTITTTAQQVPDISLLMQVLMIILAKILAILEVSTALVTLHAPTTLLVTLQASMILLAILQASMPVMSMDLETRKD
jgi:hypothetical protein